MYTTKWLVIRTKAFLQERHGKKFLKTGPVQTVPSGIRLTSLRFKKRTRNFRCPQPIQRSALPAKLRPREHRRKQRTHLLLQLKIKQSPKRNRSLPLQNRPKTRLKKIPIGSGSASLAAISTMKLSEMKPKASLPALVLKIFQTIGAVRTVVPQKRTMSSMKTSNPIENNNSLVRQEVIL